MFYKIPFEFPIASVFDLVLSVHSTRVKKQQQPFDYISLVGNQCNFAVQNALKCPLVSFGQLFCR